MNRKIRVTAWNEFRRERNVKHPARTVYPDGMHAVIAKALAMMMSGYATL
jgi:trehalose utilization protein